MIRKSLRKIKNDSQRKSNRRKLSIRKKVSGTAERPRICTIKTNKHLQVQVVDDQLSKTLFSVQTFGKNKIGKGSDLESAKLIGKAVAEMMKKSNFEKAVFDRNGKIYTGVIAAVADSIRESGVQI